MAMTARSSAWRQVPMMSVGEEQAAIEAWQTHKDRAALDRLIIAHMRLCYAEAHRRCAIPDLAEQLAQEAVFGLVDAAEKFDLTRSPVVRFATYARGHIMSKIGSAIARRMSPYGRDAQATASLNASLYDEDDGETGLDALVNNRETAEDSFGDADRKRVLERLLETLSPREQYIIRVRWLMSGEDDSDHLGVIGQTLGISGERARQVQDKAFARMRVAAKKLGIDPQDLWSR